MATHKKEKNLLKLTPKQKRFCDEYLLDLNAKQAAIRAGYSPKTAKQIGQRLLTNVVLSEYLQKRKNKLTNKLELSQEWVLERLKAISDRCMTAEPVLVFVDGEWVESGEYKFDSSGANKATELIGKYFSMFKEKVEHSGSIDFGTFLAKASTKKE